MIFLNIGSNLSSKFGNRFSNIEKSLIFLKNANIKILKRSSFFETPSYPKKKNPKFINITIEIEFNLSPINLIKKIKLIEKKMGRVKTKINDPRICDIDIIDFHGIVLSTDNIILPHPRAHLRNFVLYPLKEICSGWKHPKLNQKIDFLIKSLNFKTSNEITRLSESAIIDK
tara:strand:- start:1158 stop:1673 length:516 start_codon:yes stop_codon:yes gene_type:complete